jgi:hypothetical protein
MCDRVEDASTYVYSETNCQNLEDLGCGWVKMNKEE